MNTISHATKATFARLALACAVVLFLACASAAAAPRSVKASYSVLMNGLTIGAMTEHFESDGATYRVASDTKPLGLAALLQRQPLQFVSHGRLARGGLQPQVFEARRAAGDTPQVSAHFDWAARQLTLAHDGTTESLPLPPGTQDRLSIMYHFMFMPLGAGQHVEFAMTNGRKLDRYRYKLSREVDIDTPIGRLKTLHLVKERDPGDTGTEIWLSVQHQHLPVRMIISERDGKRYEQIIQSVALQ
jgi:hypothetical protein